jgi:hypothetical protein
VNSKLENFITQYSGDSKVKGKFLVIGQRGGRFWIRARDIIDAASAKASAETAAQLDNSPVKMHYHAVEIIHSASSAAPQFPPLNHLSLPKVGAK